MRYTDGSRYARVALACDLAALPLFVVVGMTSHHSGSAATIFLRNAVPVMTAWLIVAWVIGAYRPPAFLTLFATWALAIPAGVAVRSAFTGTLGDGRFFVFLGVAMAFTLLFLGVARSIATVIGRPWRVG
jgi:hypothetical protein